MSIPLTIYFGAIKSVPMTLSSDQPKDVPLVSIVIPHWKGREILFRCLDSLDLLRYEPAEVLLIDNGSTDGSMDGVHAAFPKVTVLKAEKNLGYAGGCNIGLDHARGEFALLLNDDAVVTEGLLDALVRAAQADPAIAACQPKILSLRSPEFFDYAGAAGGELDRYGIPFCRGRMFETCERDSGQYDAPADIFWASGACCLVRVGPVREAGLLDVDFFAHMEEIDLQWRLRNKGYRVVSVPSAVARHDAGSTLGQDRPLKVYLNHRNSLIMLVKNLETRDLFHVLPVRIVLDAGGAVYRLLKGQPLNMVAVLRSLFVLLRFPFLAGKRRSVRIRVGRTIGLYQGSILWEYFFRGRQRFSELPDRRTHV